MKIKENIRTFSDDDTATLCRYEVEYVEWQTQWKPTLSHWKAITAYAII